MFPTNSIIVNIVMWNKWWIQFFRNPIVKRCDEFLRIAWYSLYEQIKTQSLRMYLPDRQLRWLRWLCWLLRLLASGRSVLTDRFRNDFLLALLSRLLLFNEFVDDKSDATEPLLIYAKQTAKEYIYHYINTEKIPRHVYILFSFKNANIICM